MIGKSHSGSGFGGLTRYLLYGKKNDPKPDRVEWTSARELALEDPREAALLMRMTAAQGRTEEPVHHLAISLAPGEHLGRDRWEQVIDRTLKDLGLEGHQVLVVAHRDTDHEHIHLMVNRVHPETFRAWNRWQDRPRLMDSLRARELEFGLHFTPHVHDPDRLPERLMQAFIHTGEPPFLDYARAAARSIFKEARSWSELHERLAEQGLYLERKGQGLVVTDDHRHVKASSVDRAASLRALEGRLGPYEQRRPQLPEVERDLKSGQREAEINAQLAPLRQASHENSAAVIDRSFAASNFDRARDNLRAALARAYHDPALAESRYVDRLHTGRAAFLPAELGELKGTVLHTGRTYMPVGAEGKQAYELAAVEIPRLGAEYLRARGQLDQADTRLTDTRQSHEQLTRRHQPQLAELERIEQRAASLPERLLALRPRDQIAIARIHGRGPLETAVERRAGRALRTVEARERWLQNLSPELNRALDRRLLHRGLSRPDRGGDLVEWTRQALRLGLHPLHAVHALTRGKVPLADAVQAVSLTYSAARHPVKTAHQYTFRAVQQRIGLPLADAAQAVLLTRAVLRHPLRTSLWLTAKALGLPSLPVRMATMAWDLVRGQVLSR